MMAMSLADRPRPALLQVRSILKGHLFAFVWLPRDELTTAPPIAIAQMIESEVGTEMTNWSVELGDGDLALIRYTQYVDEDAPMPDADALDAAVDEMVRGWAPAVEAELIEAVGAAARDPPCARLHRQLSRKLSLANRADEAAADILRLCALRDDDDRDVRI